MKKRILFITRNFPPLTGGMERLNYHAFESLSERYETALLGPKGCGDYALGRLFTAISTTSSLRHLSHSCFEAYRLSRQWRPDLIIAGSGVAALPARFAARCSGAATVTFVHGLDIIYPSRLYQIGFVPAICRSDRVIANSANTARLARSAGVPEKCIEILHPGVTLPRQPSELPSPQSGFNLQGKRVLLAVGRLIRRKGLPEFIRYALPEIVQSEPDLLFLVVGAASESSPLKKEGIEADLQQAIMEAGMQKHVKLLGRLSDERLEQLYSIASLHIFPVLDLPGDVEGFGMVAIEAAAHGVPTIAFNSGGVPDAVKDGVTGYLVEPENYSAFSQAAIRGLNAPGKALSAQCCIEYAAHFSWDKYGQRLSAICEKTLCDPSPTS
ncbi:MAG: glycosyltransferase family 4 protein [Candidatus Polarisedimenticolaceae bacterium]|nr:glycosyltransferase family 4 protein [Candidatus Polarisedimenticolaceae bacterium]